MADSLRFAEECAYPSEGSCFLSLFVCPLSRKRLIAACGLAGPEATLKFECRGLLKRGTRLVGESDVQVTTDETSILRATLAVSYGPAYRWFETLSPLT